MADTSIPNDPPLASPSVQAQEAWTSWTPASDQPHELQLVTVALHDLVTQGFAPEELCVRPRRSEIRDGVQCFVTKICRLVPLREVVVRVSVVEGLAVKTALSPAPATTIGTVSNDVPSQPTLRCECPVCQRARA